MVSADLMFVFHFSCLMLVFGEMVEDAVLSDLAACNIKLQTIESRFYTLSIQGVQVSAFLFFSAFVKLRR